MDPTTGVDMGSFLWFLSDLAFYWIPGTVTSLITEGTANLSIPHTNNPLSAVGPMTSPLTYSDVSTYLATAASSNYNGALYHDWRVFVAISTAVSLTFMAILIYSLVRIKQIRHLERLRYAAAGQTVKTKDVPKTQLRWQRIQEQIGSDDEQQWRLAILEADIMLNEVLDLQGYRGETMGEKMKSVDRADFNTIDLAWEAHKIRNRIAHEGSAHILNAREARRVIDLYTRVFREFRLVD